MFWALIKYEGLRYGENFNELFIIKKKLWQFNIIYKAKLNLEHEKCLFWCKTDEGSACTQYPIKNLVKNGMGNGILGEGWHVINYQNLIIHIKFLKNSSIQ